jgi:glycine/D-amino acid oxidase-like deaminating enzyme
MSMSQMHAAPAQIPCAASAEVIVIGGGPAGICAAVAAAEQGADTLLVERYGFLGGMATAGLICPFMSYTSGDVQVNAGLFQRILDMLDARGARGGAEPDRAQFDPQVLKLVLDDLARDAGVRLLLHTMMVDAVAEEGRISQAVVAGKSGLQALEAGVYVDASGDGDLAARAGVRFEMGRPEDGLCQPMSLFFRMAGVDRERVPDIGKITELYRAQKAAGQIHNPRDEFHRIIPTTRPGEVTFNATRVLGHDGTDAWSLTDAEMQGRRQVQELVRFLLGHVPGFEHAYLVSIAPQTGVRETRRIMGDYVLSGDDFDRAAKFDDAVARGCFSIDIHNPTGTGIIGRHMPKGQWYDIPYRCLTPDGLDNLLVAGRPISCDHEMHGSVRVMPIAMCTGEAAGVAAALGAIGGTTTRQVDVQLLRRTLVQRGASLS